VHGEDADHERGALADSADSSLAPERLLPAILRIVERHCRGIERLRIEVLSNHCSADSCSS
jgi:hypothetical protein